MEMDLSIQQTELPKWHMAISDPPITDQMIADRESRAVVPDPAAGGRSKCPAAISALVLPLTTSRSTSLLSANHLSDDRGQCRETRSVRKTLPGFALFWLKLSVGTPSKQPASQALDIIWNGSCYKPADKEA
jgi:hypothetical protein